MGENLFKKAGAHIMIKHPKLEADDCIALTVKNLRRVSPTNKILLFSYRLRGSGSSGSLTSKIFIGNLQKQRRIDPKTCTKETHLIIIEVCR